jgi:hypothetical protein
LVTDDVDLFAALRPELDSEMLNVTWSRPSDVATALEEILPWPWAVGGTGPDVPGSAVAALAGRPVLWFWLGAAPDGLPAHTRSHQRWREMATDVAESLGRSVGGVRLAPNRGLLGPNADLILSAELEGLIAMAPRPMHLSSRALAPARRVVARRGLPLALVRDGAGVLVVADS